MADEYIKRDAALEVAIGWREQLLPNYGENDEYVKCLETVAEHLYDIPAADVRPVVHAHWIERDTGDGDAYYECSHCGEAWTLIDGTPKENNMAFCSRCGAVMDEEVDDG